MPRVAPRFQDNRKQSSPRALDIAHKTTFYHNSFYCTAHLKVVQTVATLHGPHALKTSCQKRENNVRDNDTQTSLTRMQRGDSQTKNVEGTCALESKRGKCGRLSIELSEAESLRHLSRPKPGSAACLQNDTQTCTSVYAVKKAHFEPTVLARSELPSSRGPESRSEGLSNAGSQQRTTTSARTPSKNREPEDQHSVASIVKVPRLAQVL